MNNPYISFVNFLIKHNIYDDEAFTYIRNNTTYFDYRDEDKRPSIGYYYFTDGLKITRIELCVPFIRDEITTIINVHEYIHGFSLYKKIGKRFKLENDSEVLPLLYEKIYLSENPNEQLEIFIKHLNSQITENSPLVYKIALSVQQELLEYYQEKNPNFTKLERKAKVLARRYQKSK